MYKYIYLIKFYIAFNNCIEIYRSRKYKRIYFLSLDNKFNNKYHHDIKIFFQEHFKMN